ncbi:MAG: tRNA (adenosine(37)-N6)-threonylcarbamoyltransferase complex transferase subunit TsaD [Patescibacteria group bacterium]
MIDAIAVTSGPGLEPALWVGINFAKALALLWNKPLVAVNHMEGHILAALASERSDLKSDSEGLTLKIQDVKLPILALLISGGHTELVLMNEWLQYELIGQTRDDAVGEAFDKVARMLGLSYPGGPYISALAEMSRKEAEQTQTSAEKIPRDSASVLRSSALRLPRPMINSNTCDFSFAGLKTAVLYLLKDRPGLNDEEKKHFAYEFENAVADVLWKKTSLALEQTNAQTLVIGGGVSANTHIRRTFTHLMDTTCPSVQLRIPATALTGDNAIMIALAGFYRALRKEYTPQPFDKLRASGNLSLA